MTTDVNGVYCTAPFNGLTIKEDGVVRTCCDGRSELGNLNNTPIETIEKSDTLWQIQKSMKDYDTNIENCLTCSNKEKSLMPSLRDYYNRYYKTYTLNELKLKVVDLRWNNLCNLRCMYCSSSFSSSWAAVEKRKPILIKNYQDQIAEWLIEKIDDVQELMLVGGEPMIMKQNYDIISKLPKTTRLSIITNLSYDLENLPCINALLSRPKENTVWNVSLENTDKQFEYVRQLASWPQVKKNFQFLNEHWSDIVSVNFVYSMFSAFEITNTILTLHSLGVKKFNIFGIQNNKTMDVLSMPKEIRLLAAEQLKQAIKLHESLLHPDDIDLYPLHGADAILSALQSDTPCLITKKSFYEKIEWYDQWSETKFKDLWPHILDLVDLHLQ